MEMESVADVAFSATRLGKRSAEDKLWAVKSPASGISCREEMSSERRVAVASSSGGHSRATEVWVTLRTYM